jgi:hypothetical protein
MLTFLAALNMSSELGGSANLDRLHHAPLYPVDVTGVGHAPCFTVTPEDVRYFGPEGRQIAPPGPAAPAS